MTTDVGDFNPNNGTCDTTKPTGSGIAASYLKHRKASVQEDVAGDIVLSQGLADLRDDKAQLTELMRELVKAKVLSEEEALLGLESKSHLSMLTMIGKYAHVILHESILPYLQPGYSVLYQLVLLYRDLEAIYEAD